MSGKKFYLLIYLYKMFRKLEQKTEIIFLKNSYRLLAPSNLMLQFLKILLGI